MFRALPCPSSGALDYMSVAAAYGVQFCGDYAHHSPHKIRTYITLLNTNYIFSPLQHCTP